MKVFFIIIILIFVPFPIKIILRYRMDTKLEIFLYNKKLKLNKKKAKSKPKNKNMLLLKKIYPVIKNNRFKPIIKFDINFNYDFPDASATAILYGVLYSFYSLLYKILCLPFKVKKFNFNIIPEFKDTNNINLDVSCIIFVSLAKVIYIGFNIAKQIYAVKKTKSAAM